MRVLITGIEGFAAGHLTELLSAKPGMEVHGTFRDRGKAELRLRRGSPIVLHEVDLREGRKVIRTIEDIAPEKIFHLAGRGYIPDSFADPLQTYETNVLGSVAVFEGARSLAQRYGRSPVVVHAGAGQAYDALEGKMLREDDPFLPVNPYTASKASADFIARNYRSSFGLNIIATRPFNHVGPGQSDRFVCSEFAKRVAMLSLQKEPWILEGGDIDIRRDFTDVRDVVRAYWLLSESESHHDAYNICSGTAVSIRQILDMLRQISGIPVEYRLDPSRYRKNDVPLFIGSFARLHEATGWKPEIPLFDTMRDMFTYWLHALRSAA